MFWDFFNFKTSLISDIMARSWCHSCTFLSRVKIFLLYIFLCKCSSRSLLWLVFKSSSLNLRAEYWTLFILINWKCFSCRNIVGSRSDILLNILLEPFNSILWPLQRLSFFWSYNFWIVLPRTNCISSFSFEFDLVICMSFESSILSLIIAELKVMWWNWRWGWFLSPFKFLSLGLGWLNSCSF